MSDTILQCKSKDFAKKIYFFAVILKPKRTEMNHFGTLVRWV